MLSDDDRNLKDLSDDELVRAWDLWFDLAQSTNESDPPYSHGVFSGLPPADSADRISRKISESVRKLARHELPNRDGAD